MCHALCWKGLHTSSEFVFTTTLTGSGYYSSLGDEQAQRGEYLARGHRARKRKQQEVSWTIRP